MGGTVSVEFLLQTFLGSWIDVSEKLITHPRAVSFMFSEAAAAIFGRLSVNARRKVSGRLFSFLVRKLWGNLRHTFPRSINSKSSKGLP